MPRETNIKLRRGTFSEWSSANPTLDSGEPGFDSTNKILKIGDSTNAWGSLPEAILAINPSMESGGRKYQELVLVSPLIDFKSTGETNIFTVPTGHIFFIDKMEVATTAITSAGTAPQVRFGKNGSAAAFYAASQSQSNSLRSRHIIDSPQNGEEAGVTITFGVTAASTASEHKGVAVVKGYLIAVPT